MDTRDECKNQTGKFRNVQKRKNTIIKYAKWLKEKNIEKMV